MAMVSLPRERENNWEIPFYQWKGDLCNDQIIVRFFLDVPVIFVTLLPWNKNFLWFPCKEYQEKF